MMQVTQPLGHEDSPPPKPENINDSEITEIARPEDRYSIACIGCGIEMHLQMVPHRNEYNLLVGWVFCCQECLPDVIGRRVWFDPIQD